MMRIGIVIGSTRPGRVGEGVAQWVHKQATDRGDAIFEIVDLADFDLPHLDEPVPAAMSADYQHDHTKRWARAVAACDGFVFVVPEYNHSMNGALKDALDFLYREWKNKAAGFVGYGLVGATRAVEQLRLVLAELHVATVRDQLTLSSFTDFGPDGSCAPAEHHTDILARLLDQVVAWSTALAPLRAASTPGK